MSEAPSTVVGAGGEEPPDPAGDGGPRPPTLLDATLPIVVLIGLLALTIAYFGIAATDGPLQVALLLSAAFASLIALKNGYTVAARAAVVLLGCGIGVVGSTVNPFATGIASGFAGIDLSDGLISRLIILIVGLAIGIAFVLR